MRLTLLRHAKSSWDNELLPDKARPLNARGRRDAPRMGAIAAIKIPPPYIVLASTAVRVRETIELFLGNWPNADPEIVFDEGIYLADQITLYNKVMKYSVDHVLLCAHQPGIGNLAAWLCPGTSSDMSTTEIRSIILDKTMNTLDFNKCPKDID